MESERESFSSWAAVCQPSLLRTAVLLTGDHARAEDLVQEALIKVAIRWRRLKHGNPEGYARQVLVHDNISWWRRHRRDALRPAEPHPVPSSDSTIDRRLMLKEALARLTPRQRAVVVLRYYEDLSEKQTADLMGVSTGTVKSQAHLALRRLRESAPELAELLEESS
jgi:RNA polymerase sigma-70 factor (sigma-E family)